MEFVKKLFLLVFAGNNYRERRMIQQGKEALYDYKQRYVYVNIIIIFGCIMTIVLTPTIMSEGGTPLLAAFQCMLAALMFFSFLLRRLWGGGSERFYYIYGKLLPVLALNFLFGMMFYRGGNSGFVGIWVIITPVIAVFTLGVKSGSVISALMFIWIFAVNHIPGRPEHYYVYDLGTSFRIFGSSLGVWILSVVYEQSRINSQERIYNIIDELTEKNAEIEAQNKTIMESINYAGKIQSNMLPPASSMAESFSDYSAIWKPRDVVGGDIYWSRKFEKGTVLCVADCTGHGTPGALLTMLVTSILDNIVHASDCGNTAGILWQLDQRISEVLHVDIQSKEKKNITDIDDGCDIAVLFIDKSGSVRFSTGNIPVFVCDGNTVEHHKGQKLFIGEGKITGPDEVEIIDIPANPDNKFYVASDGLFDQIGMDSGIQFGYNIFKRVVLDNHNDKLNNITAKVWEAYEHYRGEESRRDDFELIAFKPVLP